MRGLEVAATVVFATHPTLRATLTSLVAAAALHLLTAVYPAYAARAAVTKDDEQEVATTESGYLDQLLGEVNSRRSLVGASPLAFVSNDANRAVRQYLNDLVPHMVAQNTCFHGDYNPVPPAWDYVASVATLPEPAVRGEVLACPMTGYYWAAPELAETWWRSPYHQQTLYTDPDAAVVACGVFDARNGGVLAAACVVYALHRGE